MIKSSSFLLAGVAAFCVLSRTSAYAAPVNPPSYAAGDLFMGFRALGGQGAADVYIVNIGSAATYRDATGTVTPSLGSLNDDLTTLYGPDWQTRTDLRWGIVGTPSNDSATPINGDSTPTLYASKLLSTVGTPGTGWQISGASTRVSVATTIVTFQSHFVDYERSSNSTKAVIQGDGDVYSWRKFMAPGGDGPYTTGSKDFGGFSDIEAAPSNLLSLFRVNGNTAGSYEGYFSISAAGSLTFTPPSSGTTYASWAQANASNQAANVDTNQNGVANGIEWFTGLTSNPQPVAGVITWPRASGIATPTAVWVQTSTDLQTWTNQGANRASGSGSISYTLPTGQSRLFVRLSVTP